MGIKEVFKNPTVKQVIFQIRYPNLFFLESKIGEYQIKIMKDFPESSIIFQNPLVLTELSDPSKIEEAQKGMRSPEKIWEFKGTKSYKLQVTSNSLSILSEFHKTYNNEGSTDKFRDTIEKCVEAFLALTNLPVITRIGLRYIDECPLPSPLNNDSFTEYYNSGLPISRFDLSMSKYHAFKVEIQREGNTLKFSETLNIREEPFKYILDIDGFRFNIIANEYLKVTDLLHDFISDEYEHTIKEPVKVIMRS